MSTEIYLVLVSIIAAVLFSVFLLVIIFVEMRKRRNDAREPGSQ